MNKLHKIFSVVLTAAVAMSLLVVSGVAPVSADNNLWSQVVTPSKTNQVMANNITSSCFLTTAANGDLFAYVQTTSTAVPPVVTDNLARSTNGGRSWTYVVAPGHINAIFCAKTEANVVYFSVGNTLYKSTDSGATFATRGTVAAGDTIKAIGAALAGGSYKVMVGTANATFTGNTYFQDEGQFFLSFTPFGTWGTRGNVMDLKLSPNFAVDQGIVALATTDGASAMVNFSTGGGVWGANLMSVPLPTGAGFAIGEIGLPSDFTTSAAIFFVGVTGTASAVAPITAPGLYRVTGSTAVVAPTLLDAGQAASVDVVGAFATASIMYGTSGGTIRYSTNSGQSWTSGAKLPVLPAGIVWVTLKSDYATSLTAYAEIAGNGGSCAPNDESGFFMSTDSGKDWNGISLLNSTIADINMNQLAMASNGDMFMITSATGGNHSLWRYFGGNWERVIGNVASTALNMIAVSPNYVTDKAVFYVDAANLINYSTNNGNTFSKQSVSAGTIAALQVIDLNTFVAATAGGIVRTTNNGFIWNTVSPSSVSTIVRSSDGTTLAAYTSTGAIIKSTDLGATWSTASTDTAQLMAGVTAIAFQNGSNNVIWATTVGGLFSIDLSATTVTWSANKASAVGSTNVLDSAIFANGVAIGSGIAPTGSTVVYALNSVTGAVARDLSLKSTVSGNIAAAATPVTSASALFVQPAVGANKLTVIIDNAIYTYTDQLAVAVAGVTAVGTTGANATSTAVVNWTAVTGADRYSVAIVAGSTAITDPYSNAFIAASINGTTTTLTMVDATNKLQPNTTYTVSVWAVRTSATGNAVALSFAGTKTFTTQPGEVTVPINLAPAAGSTGISITPGLAWGAVAGATSYTVELSTVNTFATLVGTKQTTTIPAFAWTTPALAYSTTYYWRVTAITATGSSDPVVSVFTTMAAPVTTTTGPTTAPITITNTSVVVTTASTETPAYVWAIIGIGALLVIVVIVLIVRTRRVA